MKFSNLTSIIKFKNTDVLTEFKDINGKIILNTEELGGLIL